jgi:metalloendopeptidase OMA1, mitochondrial
MRRGLGGLGVLLPLVIGGIIAFSVWCGAEEQEVPVTGRDQRVAISEEEQERLGEQAYADVLSQQRSAVVESGSAVEIVEEIGGRIAEAVGGDDPGFEWEFTVVESPELNAFCLPGGKVVVYTGIIELAGNEDRLATVMAHEVAHAIAQHGAERMLQQQLKQIAQTSIAVSLASQDPATRGALLSLFGAGAQYGVLLPFSRDHESEADHIGLIYMARAGFDPRAAVEFWELMGEASGGQAPPEYASTHPSSETRIRQIEEWMAEALEEYEES